MRQPEDLPHPPLLYGAGELRAQGVAHAALFGSVTRGDQRPGSVKLKALPSVACCPAARCAYPPTP